MLSNADCCKISKWKCLQNRISKLAAVRYINSPFYSNIIGLVHFAMESEDNVTANTSILEQPITVNSCSSKFSSISFENLENVSKMLT